VLSLLVLTTAAVNRLMLVPQLRQTEPELRATGAKSLRRSTLIEIGLAVAVLVLAARLTAIPPADAPLTVDVASRSGTIALEGESNDVSFAISGELRNEPDGVIRIAIVDTASGAPVTDLVRVIVDARAPDPLDPDGEPIQDRFDASVVVGEPGVYEVPRARFGLEAEWQIEVIARRLGLVDESIEFTLDLNNTAPQPPRLTQEEWQLPRIPWSGYLALVAAALTAIGSLWLIRRLKGLEPVTAGIILAVAGMITLGFLLSAWRSGPIPIAASELPFPANPNDPAAIQRAASTWATQCASCHGVDAAGTGDDQPDGGHAHPSVAGDLLGPQSRARTPEELFWIVSNGLGGTTMPAFDLALTDQERADLVAYLLWLQAQADE
jgi:mono/diheme cytochrome c family protein